MIDQDFALIGKQKKQRVHKGKRVSVGEKELISTVIPISLFALIGKRVSAVRLDRTAPAHQMLPDC